MYPVEVMPENAPGPYDSVYLFDSFLKLMEGKFERVEDLYS